MPQIREVEIDGRRIKKLSKCPEDAEVLIPNDESYISGDYVVTEIENWDDHVEITTDYKKRRV